MRKQKNQKIIELEKMIWCRIRKKFVSKKPEEEIRQEFLDRLIEEYGYPEEFIDVEVPVIMGRKPKSNKKEIKKADIIIYPNKESKIKKENDYIIVETKFDDDDGEKQLKSYGNANRASIIVWTDGTITKYWKSKEKPRDWEPKLYLPKFGQKYGSKQILKNELRPAINLKSNFKKFHNDLRVSAKSEDETKIFDQVMYLLFAKIEDELNSDKECKFMINDYEDKEILQSGKSDSFINRITELFENLRNRAEYKNVFDGSEKIEVPPKQLASFVSGIEYLTLLKSDSKGEAYQAFVSNYFRRTKGQYFTPDAVKELMVELISPEMDEIVLDPACGTSGFLIYVIKYLKNKIKTEKKWVDKNGIPITDSELNHEQRELLINKIKNIATVHLRGVEKEPNLSKVGKIWMLMMDDGHTGIFNANSLASFDQLSRETSGEIKKECANIILTNPPFGSKSKVTENEILINYELGHRWSYDKESKLYTKGDILDGKNEGQVPDILFIERCLDLLKKGGRMAIILPDGDLNNMGTKYLRFWLKNQIQYVGIISLPRHTFLPYGANEKTSIVILIKPKNHIKKRYPIFFYEIEKLGYDGQGKIQYKKNDEGEILDCHGKIIPYDIFKSGKNKGKNKEQNKKLIEDNGCIDSNLLDVTNEWKKFLIKYKEYL